MKREININMTGHTILMPGFELAPEMDFEHGPLDAPDWIPAGYAIGGRQGINVALPPIPRSVSREQKTC